MSPKIVKEPMEVETLVPHEVYLLKKVCINL